jgi:hypothetical protein
MNNENENANATGLTFGANESATGFDVYAVETANLSALERIELKQRILEADAALKFAALPIKKSNEIIGVAVTILDARLSTIEEVQNKEIVQKPVVNFLLKNQETGELFSVTKGSNNFNNAYIDYFNIRRGIAEQPLFDFEFVEDSNYSKNGNDAIVLRRIQKQVSNSTSKGKA